MALFTHTHSLLIKFGRTSSSLFLSHFLWTRSHGLSRSLSLSLDAFTRSVSYLSSPRLSLFSLVSLSLSSSLRLYIFVQFAMQFGARICYWFVWGKCWEGGEKTRKKITKKSGVILFCLICEAFFWWLKTVQTSTWLWATVSTQASKQGNYGAGVLLYVCGAGQGWHRGEIWEVWADCRARIPVCQLDMWTPPCRLHFLACAAAGCAVRDQNQGKLQRACCAALCPLCACVCLHEYDLLQLCGVLSLRRGALFLA